MAARSNSTPAPGRDDLSAATWLRHAALLRDLVLTGPAQHRHVYAEAAREAGAHAEMARWAEAVFAAFETPILAEAA